MGRGGQGRPAKPTNLKVLHGDRKDRINDGEPVPAAVEVVPPAWFAEAAAASPEGQESALDVWHRMAPDLIDKGVLTTWDVEAFAVYCDVVVRFRQASMEVSRTGMTIDGARGTVKNPAVTAAKDYADLMHRYGARFGLTPSDRAGLKVERGDPRGGAAKFLSGG